MKNISTYINEQIIMEANTKPEQRLFIMIKPGFLDKMEDIINELSTDLTIYKRTIKKLTLDEAQQIYDVHKDQPFYNDLCEYMSSDMSCGMIVGYKSKYVFNKDKDKFVLKYTNNSNLIETVSGIKDIIRTEFGTDDMRNVMHSSDSYEHSITESNIYFGFPV